MMKIVCIVAVVLAFALAVPAAAPSKEVVRNMELSADRTRLTFDAFGQPWSLALERAAHTAPGEGHYEGVVEGDHESVAHVNVYADALDAVFQAGGEYYFVEYDVAADAYHIAKEPDFHPEALAEAVLPQLGEEAIAPSLAELEASGDLQEALPETAARGVASRPSAIKVAAYWDTATPAFVSRDPRGLVRGFFSTLNTIVMRPKGLPQFQVTMKGGLRGRGAHSDRGRTHDWFTAYIKARRSQVSGFHVVSWSPAVNFGGRAWLGTACNPRYPMEYKTGVSGITVWSASGWSRAYTLRILAHEVGHNLGAPHNFGSKSIMDYYWPRGSFNTMVGFFNSVDISNMRKAGCA